MESIITSQKSIMDIKDPLIKNIVKDVSNILQAELLQTISVLEKPSVYVKPFQGKIYSEVQNSFASLSEQEKARLGNLRKSILASEKLKHDLHRLGINLNHNKPASQQVDYSKKFGYLRGKAEIIDSALGRLGRSSTVPFAQYPNQAINNLIKKIKAKDVNGKEYADYLGLLDTTKLVDLFQKEFGPISDKAAFFEKHEPCEEEIVKIRRLVKGWELAPAKPNYAKYQNRFLKLKVNRVKCVDETEHEGPWPFQGEGVANDRIDLGAISISPDGRTTQFGPRMVSDNFEDNREVVWEQEIASFDLLRMGSYPMSFGVTVAISEIDYGGGFANVLKDIFNSIKGVVVEVLAKIGEVIGALVGAGEVGKVIGKIVGELVILGLGELISIVGRAVQDDVFPAQVVTLQLDSRYSTPWGVDDKSIGPFALPVERLSYNGFGGAYEVYTYWELIREAVV
jgi:hypothetical protein